MLDHPSIQCADVAASATFYDAALASLGGRRVMDFGEVIGFGVPPRPGFWIGPRTTGEGFRERHIAFAAPDRAAVRAFFQAAVSVDAEERRLPACRPRCERAAPVFPPRQARPGGLLRRYRGRGPSRWDAHGGVVLVDPPAKAQPDERVSYGEAEQAIAPACAEDLVVPRIMADEAELGEDDPVNAATARVVHELPTITNRAHPARKAKIVRVIFDR
jgi:catechol 2,3-dioxygenase-like lactoylglutathione lyase family enzyme